MNPKEKFPFSEDWSVMKNVGRVRVKGRVDRIHDDLETSHVPPLSDQYTVILDVSKEPRYYLKFRTKDEMKALSFTEDEEVDVEGDLCIFGSRGKSKNILTNVRRTRL